MKSIYTCVGIGIVALLQSGVALGQGGPGGGPGATMEIPKAQVAISGYAGTQPLPQNLQTGDVLTGRGSAFCEVPDLWDSNVKFTVRGQFLWAELNNGVFTTIETTDFDTGANALDEEETAWPHVAPGDDYTLGTATPSYIVPGPGNRPGNGTHIVLEVRAFGQDVFGVNDYSNKYQLDFDYIHSAVN